mgnify:CR=1 FL=1
MTIDEEIYKRKRMIDYSLEYLKKEYCNNADMINHSIEANTNIIKWLEELKNLREQVAKASKFLDFNYESGYNKGVDDYNCYVKHEEAYGRIKSLDDYNRIAEQLKVGVENDIQ